MKIIRHIAALAMALMLLFILLITSIEILLYHTPGYFEKEYAQNHVTDVIDISDEDLMKVTDQMMAYLHDDRSSLYDITATIGGRSDIPVFNERECLHMADCKALFVSALHMRFVCIVLWIVLFVMLLITGRGNLRLIAHDMLIGCIILASCIIILVMICAIDFEKYFTIFHQIFFNNDLWILNPATDNLINMVPQRFFIDTAIMIAIYYGISIAIVIIASLIILKITDKSRKAKYNSNNM